MWSSYCKLSSWKNNLHTSIWVIEISNLMDMLMIKYRSTDIRPKELSLGSNDLNRSREHNYGHV